MTTALQNTTTAAQLTKGSGYSKEKSLRVKKWRHQLKLFDKSMETLKSLWQPKEFISGNEILCFEIFKDASNQRKLLAEEVTAYLSADQIKGEQLRLRIETRWIVLSQFQQIASVNFVLHDHLAH